jgi:hypothetical protein
MIQSHGHRRLARALSLVETQESGQDVYKESSLSSFLGGNQCRKVAVKVPMTE